MINAQFVQRSTCVLKNIVLMYKTTLVYLTNLDSSSSNYVMLFIALTNHLFNVFNFQKSAKSFLITGKLCKEMKTK